MNWINKIPIIIGSLLWAVFAVAQSDNCNTATVITLTNGAACVNGTTTNSTSNNTMYGTCNTNPVNEVWYTYVSSGSQNDYTVTSNGITEIEIMIDIDGCNNTTFETCGTQTGTNTLTHAWGVPAGTQVWVMIASNGGLDGDFELCINSYDPPPGNGNTCSGAIPLCDVTQTYNTPDIGVLQSSGNTPPCFQSPPSQDIWYQFTVTQTGLLEWEANPIGSGIELDWSMYDITSGCPGSLIACNYNYAGNTSASAGMITGVSCTTCPTSANPGPPCGEYCDPIVVTAGNTYAIQIDNYTGTPNTGLNFDFGPGMTALIAPDADFTINPSGITCGTNVTVNITDVSLGVPDWTFGNGNTFTGNNPPTQTYTVPGVYAITATITGACPSVHTEYVEIYGPLTATSSAVNENCGACDGSASVTADGGDGIFTYLWNTGASTPTITGLCAGSYSVTVSNAVCSTQVVETIVVNSGGSLNFTNTNTNVLCAGANNGTASVTPTSGSSPYTYLWSDGQSTSTAIGLIAGSYSVTITDAAGCDTIATIIVNEPAPLVIDTTGMIITDASCSGSDGSIIGITASGGTGTLTYSWEDVNSTVVGSAVNLSNIPTGSFTIYVNDANGCSAQAGPFAVAANTVTTLTATGLDANCNGQCDGMGTINVTGGTPPYAYFWDTSPPQTNATAVSLCAGTYNITVTDNSCTPSGMELTANGDFSAGNTGFSSSYFFCNSSLCLNPTGGYGIGTNATFYNTGFTGSDHTTGSGNFMVINGSSTPGVNVWCETISINPNTNYQFSTWLASINSQSPAILQFTANGIPLGATINAPGNTGTWIQFAETWNSGSNTSVTICITNQNTASGGNDFGLDDISFQECTNACPSTTSIVITDPSILSASLNNTDVLCFSGCDGTASVSVSGGIAPYTYSWSNSSNSSSITGLCAGNYAVTIFDSKGCDTIQSFSINQPSMLLASGTTIASKCGNNDGSATVNPSGGISPYTYLWDDPNAQSTQTADSLIAQTYNVTISDANGCNFILPVTIGFVDGPEIDTMISTALNCFGDSDGSVSVSIINGTPPLVYAWDNGSTTSTITGLMAGSYTVTITDLYSCDTVGTITVTEPTQLLVNVMGTDTMCYGETGGVLNASASGGTPQYTYIWNNLATSSSIIVSPTNTKTYSVSITDSNNCQTQDSSNIFVSPALVASVTNEVICEGDNILISVSASFGNGGPYNYLWNEGSTTSAITISPLTNTNYQVTVTDGCSMPTNEALTVNVSPNPEALFAVSCFPDPYVSQFTDESIIDTGNITSWFWDFDDGNISTEQHPVHDYSSATTYNVNLTVTSADGCIDEYSLLVQSPPIASFSPYPPESTTANPIIEFTDASINNITTWNWNFGDGSSTTTTIPIFTAGGTLPHTYDSAGIYKITLMVTDINGCLDTASEYVQIFEEYILFAPNTFTPNGNGLNEEFMPVGVGFDNNNFEMLIYDRWGDLIFKTRDYKKPWDGKANNGTKEAQADVYVWMINSTDPKKKKHQYIGHVTLVK